MPAYYHNIYKIFGHTFLPIPLRFRTSTFQVGKRVAEG